MLVTLRQTLPGFGELLEPRIFPLDRRLQNRVVLQNLGFAPPASRAGPEQVCGSEDQPPDWIRVGGSQLAIGEFENICADVIAGVVAVDSSTNELPDGTTVRPVELWKVLGGKRHLVHFRLGVRGSRTALT